MNKELWIAIANFAVKFGIDAAAVLLEEANKPAATIDDAITALRSIQTKSADDYLAEARAKLSGVLPMPASTDPVPPPAPTTVSDQTTDPPATPNS